MAWTTPGTAVAGSVLEASFWNEQVRDNSAYLFNPPAVRCTKSATQSINATTATSLIFGGTDDYDTDSMHNPSSNNTRITINTAGVYVVSAGAVTTTGLGGYVELFVTKNGGVNASDRLIYGGLDSSALTSICVSGIVELAVGDYIEAVIFLENAKTISTSSTVPSNHFAAHWLGSGA